MREPALNSHTLDVAAPALNSHTLNVAADVIGGGGVREPDSCTLNDLNPVPLNSEPHTLNVAADVTGGGTSHFEPHTLNPTP